MKLAVKILIWAMLAGLPAVAGAQVDTNYIPTSLDDNRYIPVDFHLTLKNMHLWRGLQVTSEATTAVDFYYKNKSDSFRIGLWGGAGVTGAFREFDYFVSYSYKGFNIAVWDIYNFSPGADYNNTDVFNYKAHHTGHFIDIALSYRFQGNFPLNLGWATIIHGRDRGTDNRRNLYSTYVFADYPILRHRIVDLDLGMAGAFALRKEKGTNANFYGKDPGIVNVSLSASKKIKLGNYVLPVAVTSMWNPVNNNANIQLSVMIF